MSLLCFLESVVLQKIDILFADEQVVTVDNNSVTIVNIAVYHVLLEVTIIYILQYFLNIILMVLIFIKTRTIIDTIKDELKIEFKKYDLKLV